MSRNIKIINRVCNFKIATVDSIKDKVGCLKKEDIDAFKKKMDCYLDKVLDEVEELSDLMDDGIDRFGDKIYSYYDNIKGNLDNLSGSKVSSVDELKPMMLDDMDIDRDEVITGLKEFKREVIGENIESLGITRKRSRGILSISMIVVISLLLIGLLIGISLFN